MAQLVDSLADRSGGVPELAAGVGRAAAARFESHVYGIADGDPAGGIAGGESGTDRWAPAEVHPLRALGPRRLALAPSLLPRLLGAGLDLVHAHGLWTPQSLATVLWAARTGRPYVVSVHGMLDPWSLRRARARKSVAAALYERRRLRRAACVHVLGPFEGESVRAFAGPVQVCDIPPAVELPALAEAPTSPPWANRVEAGRRVLLYLGRVHPKKGLAGLLRSFARARAAAPALADPWCVVIVGWDEGGHTAALQRLGGELGLGAAVVFAGGASGPARDSAYASADACALPSVSEGLPLTVLEAWARGLPVLITDACHLPCGFAAEAALRLDGEADHDAGVLLELFAMSGADRRAMGARGRALVEQRFSWPMVGRQYLDVYSWALGGGAPPACVHRA